MKKGLKTLIGGILVFVGFAFVLPFAVVMPMVSQSPDEEQFRIPGEHTVTVEKEGRYYLWNNYRTIYEGKSYNRSEEVPDGLEFKITPSSGEQLNFVGDSSTSVSIAGRSKQSVGYVNVSGPDTLTISVTGEAEPHIFSFSESVFFKMFGTMIGIGLLSILGAGCGVGLVIWGTIKLMKKDRSNLPPAMPSA